MEKKDKISKVTKVILNDLKGRRVVHHNFSENKIEKIINEKKNVKSKKTKDWEFLLWSFASVLFVSLFVVGIFTFGGGGNKENKSVNQIEKNYTNTKKKIIRKDLNTNINKKLDKIYKWKDKGGMTNYTNVPGGGVISNITETKLPEVQSIKNWQSENEKTQIEYIAYMKNGGKINCKNVTKNEDIVIMRTKSGVLMNLHKSEIKKIEKYTRKNDQLMMSVWDPFKKG